MRPCPLNTTRLPCRLGGILLTLVALAATSRADRAVLPDVEVRPGTLREEQPVGAYGAPAWTAVRRFPTTRVYLQRAPGEMAVEQWWRGRFYEDGTRKQRFQEEFEMGLPGRLQLDTYINWTMVSDEPTRYDSTALELRHAFADWGRCPLNPTVYVEWKAVDEGADVLETKLLLGEELGRGWHWGLNLVREWETGGERAIEYAVSQAFSFTVVDSSFSVGVEMAYSEETVAGGRSDPERSGRIGPSVQWRPTARTHLDIVPLFGVTDEAPDVEAYVVAGIDFGGGEKRGHAPVSLQSQ